MSCSLLCSALSVPVLTKTLHTAGLGWAGLAGLVGNGMGLQLKFRLTHHHHHRHRAAEAAWRESSGFGAKQDIDLAGLGTL